MKKKMALGLCLVLIAVMIFTACTPKDPVADELTAALSAWVKSEDFQKTVSVKTTQDRMALMYLKYVNGDFYSDENKTELTTLLGTISEIIDGTAISGAKWAASSASAMGFYSVEDYLYTWSMAYNQHKYAVGGTDYDGYLSAIDAYLSDADGIAAAVAWGYSAPSVLVIIKANLNLSCNLPQTDAYFASRYAKTDGRYQEITMSNWSGPTGDAVAASLYTGAEFYDAAFEKSMQGYFPFTNLDGWGHPLEQMVTLNSLTAVFDGTLAIEKPEYVSPQWALLTGIMHGINMKEYIGADNTVNDVLAAWVKSIRNADGKIVIDNNEDMAVAIAYLALNDGIKAPTPLGLYETAQKVVKLK